MIKNTEREKWDKYYASLPLNEADEATTTFNAQLVERISELLPPGSRILEAGCGGGWQGLALARSRRFHVSLMDFSREALRYAERLFEREQIAGEFIQGDVFTSGEPEFDLVFNAGVLEHYTLESQAAFLRGMASRSKDLVLALVPNRSCYWYWLWRIQKAADKDWPFGKESPSADLSAVFEVAGLQFLGQDFMGETWTESFITELLGANTKLCDEILTVHRSPLIPKQQKSYLTAALGSVWSEHRTVPGIFWAPALTERVRGAETMAALADALALRIGAEQELNRLQTEVSEKFGRLDQKEQTIVALSDQVLRRDGLAQDLISQLAEQARTVGLLKAEIEEKQHAIASQSVELAERDHLIESLSVQQAESKGLLASIRAQAEGKDRTIESLTTQENEQAQRVQLLLQEVAEKEEASAESQRRAEEKDQTVRSLIVQAEQREQAIYMLSDQLAAQEVRLDQMTNTLGWRLLSRYGPIKYRYLLPIYRLLGLMPSQLKKTGNLETIHALLDQIAQQTETVHMLSSLLAETGHETPTSSAESEHRTPRIAGSNAYDVICFPIIEWGFRFQRPQQLMSRFAAGGHRVFYITQEFRSSGEPFTIHRKGPNIFEVSLRGPDRHIYSDVLDEEPVNELFESLEALRRDLSFGATVAFVQLPFWWPLAKKTRARFGWPIVYDCMDYHAGFSTNKRKMIRQEHELLSSADLTLASSTSLENHAKQQSSNVLLLRNACDYEHFAKASKPTGGRPVVGYYGAIADWFDSDLVADLARERPDWDFVLVGSTFSANISRLSKLPNITLTGEKTYLDIPNWLGKFDVAIIPFKRTPLTEATNPVKAYEILASGKPLVSVPIPEMVSLGPLVRLASNAEEFEEEIGAALDERDSELIEKRREFAREHTWERRYEALAPMVRDVFPKASIIILTFNNLELNRICLESLYERTEWPNFEVIVVDNASTDGTREYLKEAENTFENLRVILNERNLGFAAANNIGLKQASGEYLVLLNNDTVLTRGWLSTMIRHLHANPEIGLIGPVTNEAGNEAKVRVGYTRLDNLPGWAADFVRENDGQVFSIPMLAMFCVSMRREVFERTGLLEERFEIGMFEDDDYSRRVEELGYKIICARDSFVHHEGRASFKLLGEDRYLKIFQKNRKVYEEKWGKWKPHIDEKTKAQVPGLLKKLRSIVKRSGVDANSVVVFLPSIGWNTPLVQRPHHLARELARQGFLVFFDCSGSIIDRFAEFFQVEKNLWLYKGPAGVLETIENPVLWTLPYNADLVERWTGGRIVYDYIDDLSVFPYKQDGLRMSHSRTLEKADLVLCVARSLMDQVSASRPDALYVPNGVEYGAFSSESSSSDLDIRFKEMIEGGRPVVGYHGAIASWFDIQLIVEVARQRPDWNFVIIGQKLPDAPSLKPLEELSNVLVLRSQPYKMLPAYLSRFTAAMIPFKINQITEATSPIKLYEYFAGGKVVISTPLPECQAFEEVLIVRNAQEFSRSLDVAIERSRDSKIQEGLRSVARDNSWDVRVRTVAASLPKKPTKQSLARNGGASSRLQRKSFSSSENDNGHTLSGTIDGASEIAKRFRRFRTSRNERFFEALASHLSGIASDPGLPATFEYAITCNERGRKTAKLLRKYTKLRGKRFLDIGCAYGGFLVALAEQGAEVAGIDIDEALLYLAEYNMMDNALEVPLLARDATHATDLLEFRDRFDVITCIDVIEHVDDPHALLCNVADMLRSNGTAYFEIPNRYHPGYVRQDGHHQPFGIALLDHTEAKEYFSLQAPSGPHAVRHHLDIEQYAKLFERAGMRLTVLDESLDSTSVKTIVNDAAELRASAKASLSKVASAMRGRVEERLQQYLNEIESSPRATASQKREFMFRFGASFWRIIGHKTASGQSPARIRSQSDSRAGRFRGMSFHPGKCNVCGKQTQFFYRDKALYRESLVCCECLTTSRYRSIARGVLRAIRELAGVEADSIAKLDPVPENGFLRIYDTQVPFYYETNAYPIPDLLSKCNWIDVQTSIFRARDHFGIKLGRNITNQNLEELTFADNTFDIVITSDVMEHVRLDDKAHQEIKRVLKPGGAYLFTVPHFRQTRETLVRVAVVDPADPTKDQFLMQKEYHGDANSEECRALSYRAYGTDLDERLQELGFSVDYSKADFPEMGIMNTELFFCRLSK
jgi:2-polyprenyl-3-methyl-5-hydroxy-6-metoxy-1,4-benzoquinol methylase/GT2 family glycosyltransferase